MPATHTILLWLFMNYLFYLWSPRVHSIHNWFFYGSIVLHTACGWSWGSEYTRGRNDSAAYCFTALAIMWLLHQNCMWTTYGKQWIVIIIILEKVSNYLIIIMHFTKWNITRCEKEKKWLRVWAYDMVMILMLITAVVAYTADWNVM